MCSSLVNQQLLVITLGRVCVCFVAAGITNDSSICDGIMPAATSEFTGVLGDSISFNLEMLSDGSLFAGVPDSSEDLSSGVEMTLDTEVLDSVVDVVGEYTWPCVKRFLSIAFLSRGYIPHFLNPVLIKAVYIDSHGSLKSFVKFVLQQLTGFFHPSVATLTYWVNREKCDLTGWNITTSRGWNICVLCGGKQYKWMF